MGGGLVFLIIIILIVILLVLVLDVRSGRRVFPALILTPNPIPLHRFEVQPGKGRTPISENSSRLAAVKRRSVSPHTAKYRQIPVNTAIEIFSKATPAPARAAKSPSIKANQGQSNQIKVNQIIRLIWHAALPCRRWPCPGGPDAAPFGPDFGACLLRR